jgi:hypothetical protein
MCVVSFRALKGSTGTADDGFVIATMPATDAEGNRLRPLIGGTHIPCVVDINRVDGSGRAIIPRIIVNTNGQVQIYGVANNATFISTAGGWYSVGPLA